MKELNQLELAKQTLESLLKGNFMHEVPREPAAEIAYCQDVSAFPPLEKV